MAQSRSKNASRNIVFGLLNKVVTLVLPFVVRTIIIYTLGNEYVGLSSLFTSLLHVLNLSELGFRSAIVYSMYKPIAEKDIPRVNALLNEFKRVYRIVGCVMLFAGVIMSFFLDKLVKGDCPPDVNLYVLFWIYLFNTVSSYFLFAYKSSLLMANQRRDIISTVDMVLSIIEYILQITLLLIFKNYYVYIIIVPMYTIANNIFCARAATKLWPEYTPVGTLSKEERKDLYSRTGAVLGHKIGATVINSADSIVISAFLGLSILGIYSNYYLIMTSIVSIFTVVYTSIVPSIGNSIVTESEEKNYELFQKLYFITAWVVGFCSCCFLCLYQPFMRIWVGENRLLPFYMVVWLAIYFYTWQFRAMGLHFKDAAGMWKQDLLKPYIGAVINVATNIILVQLIGLVGALISTIVIFVIIYFPWETKVLFNDLFECSAKKYLINTLIYVLATCGVSVVCLWLCNIITVNNPVLQLAIDIAVCCLVFNGMYFMVFKRSKYIPEVKAMLLKSVRRN
ncbi:lipopolysaccharide biosynthesis protein [Butyrivibrio sp. NC2007]|uniref:lipopolysaccharide biosynthesis protein n=1 Tax=Butyrivibrio sp. NC2007 TaxID=1280683 RepID=UPI0003B7ACB0|nr:oligosaccharide flippase family protein [Butyrivibrio sp. NC2007]